MNEPDLTSPEYRVLVLATTGRDATNSKSVLARVGVLAVTCRDYRELCREIGAGAGAILLTEEALSADSAKCLTEELHRQARWSDLPIVLLVRGGPDSGAAIRGMQTLGNVFLLERPVRVSTLVTAVQTALRARSRQYEIREYLDALQEADRRKDEFLAMLAHELRNPLAPIRNAMQIMQMPNLPSEVLAHAREMTERQVSHMSRLIDDLLEVSRVSRGKIQLKKELVDLAGIIARAVEVTQATVNAKEHVLNLSLPPQSLPLFADPARLEQVFVNLVTNAAKYTPPGGRIDVFVDQDGEQVIVHVRDTGVGISPTLLPHVFDLFVQAEQGSDRSQGGLGIGLTLVRSLVEMHNGKVEARSGGVDQGSEFIVRLPLTLTERTAVQRSSLAENPTVAAKRRILVVDDNLDAAESLALLLTLQGHVVRTAHDAAATLSTASTFKPQVVLLDIGLPGMDGYEIAQRLRNQDGGGGLVLVAITGYAQEEDRRRSREAGFDFHLSKPADLNELQIILAESNGQANPSSLDACL